MCLGRVDLTMFDLTPHNEERGVRVKISRPPVLALRCFRQRKATKKLQSPPRSPDRSPDPPCCIVQHNLLVTKATLTTISSLLPLHSNLLINLCAFETRHSCRHVFRQSEGMSVNILTHTYVDGHTHRRRPRDAKYIKKYISANPRSYTDTHTFSSEKSEKRMICQDSMCSANQDFLRKC